MGRYLAIGLLTNLYFKKEEAERNFGSVTDVIEHVRKNYAPEDVFSMEEEETSIYFSIRPDIFLKEMQAFLNDFYSLRFSHKSDLGGRDNIISKLHELHSMEEVMSLADEKIFENFQEDSYWDNIYIKGKGWSPLKIQTRGIDLSIDGKILLEYEDGLFQLFSSLLQEKLKTHKLSKALRVTITG